MNQTLKIVIEATVAVLAIAGGLILPHQNEHWDSRTQWTVSIVIASVVTVVSLIVVLVRWNRARKEKKIDKPLDGIEELEARTLIKFSRLGLPEYQQFRLANPVAVSGGVAFKNATVGLLNLCCCRLVSAIESAAYEVRNEEFFVVNNGVSKIQAFVAAIKQSTEELIEGTGDQICLLDEMDKTSCNIKTILVEQVQKPLAKLADQLDLLNEKLGPEQARKKELKRHKFEMEGVAEKLDGIAAVLIEIEDNLVNKANDCRKYISCLNTHAQKSKY